MERYNKNILSLQTFEGFLARFQSEIKHHRTHKEAYEEVELRHYYYYNKNKYSSYESFKTVMSKNNKK